VTLCATVTSDFYGYQGSLRLFTMSSRQRGRAFIDRNKAGILATPANSCSGTSRPGSCSVCFVNFVGLSIVPDPFKFLPSLRSHYVDSVDLTPKVKSHAQRTRVGWAETQGRRGNMEDQIVCSAFSFC
jgi:hypothetical protein